MGGERFGLVLTHSLTLDSFINTNKMIHHRLCIATHHAVLLFLSFLLSFFSISVLCDESRVRLTHSHAHTVRAVHDCHTHAASHCHWYALTLYTFLPYFVYLFLPSLKFPLDPESVGSSGVARQSTITIHSTSLAYIYLLWIYVYSSHVCIM